MFLNIILLVLVIVYGIAGVVGIWGLMTAVEDPDEKRVERWDEDLEE